VSCDRLTTEDYAYYALGTLEDPQRSQLRAHLSTQCAICLLEAKEALEFWFIFAALTERMQGGDFAEPSPELRDRVINIGRAVSGQREKIHSAPVRTWMRIAAGIVIAVGVTGLSWRIGRFENQKHLAAAQRQIEEQTSAVRKLGSENRALQNLVVAARNAPAVFPGREAIVSVQDPYVARDLQSARQTQVAMSQALTEEHTRAADLEKRLSQTNTLLAAATREKEAADRQYQNAFDAATMEKKRGANQLSAEISTYKSKLHDLEAEVARDRTILDLQKKGMEQHTQMLSLVQLRGTEFGQANYGLALIADNARLAFFPVNLPAAPAGRTYQLWLMRDKGSPIVSAGTFSVGAKDLPALQFGNQEILSGVKAFAVTEEPAGGSSLPTGRKVLAGTTKG